MDIRQTEEYQEYKMARDSIQMDNARVINFDVKNVDRQIVNEPVTIKITLQTKLEKWQEDLCAGFLKAIVIAHDQKTKNLKFSAIIECLGEFRCLERDLPAEEFERRVRLQTVPQLLPYVRSALSTLTGMFSNVPIVLPTMDVLKSIRKNKEHDQHDKKEADRTATE